MNLSEVGWMRPLLSCGLIALGVFLRFGRVPGAFFAAALAGGDDDMKRRTARRVGEVLFAWAGWVILQEAAGMPESWVTTLWAPLVITAVFGLTYPARLYARKYLGAEAPAEGGAGDPAIPARGGWLWVVLRELVPLSAYLAPILIVREAHPELPDRIPVSWSFGDGLVWAVRDQAVRVLRHQTMIVYLILILLEGVYLIVRWARGRRRDIARVLLTRGHWLYFFFRVGWVTLFAGLNLGFVIHAVDGRSPLPYLLPGLLGLAAFGALLAADARRRASPPSGDGPGG